MVCSRPSGEVDGKSAQLSAAASRRKMLSPFTGNGATIGRWTEQEMIHVRRQSSSDARPTCLKKNRHRSKPQFYWRAEENSSRRRQPIASASPAREVIVTAGVISCFSEIWRWHKDDGERPRMALDDIGRRGIRRKVKYQGHATMEGPQCQ